MQSQWAARLADEAPAARALGALIALTQNVAPLTSGPIAALTETERTAATRARLLLLSARAGFGAGEPVGAITQCQRAIETSEAMAGEALLLLTQIASLSEGSSTSMSDLYRDAVDAVPYGAALDGTAARLLALLTAAPSLDPPTRMKSSRALAAALQEGRAPLPEPGGDRIELTAAGWRLEPDPWWAALQSACEERLGGVLQSFLPSGDDFEATAFGPIDQNTALVAPVPLAGTPALLNLAVRPGSGTLRAVTLRIQALRAGLLAVAALRADRVAAPIVMLTARGEEADRIQGLGAGADDYVVKPFSMEELLLRISALIQRSGGGVPGVQGIGEVVRFGDCEVHFTKFFARCAGREAAMSPRELELMQYFLRHEGLTLHRFRVLSDVWGPDEEPTTRTVDQHVLKLRKKIEVDPASPRHLITVHGVGYRFSRAPLAPPASPTSR